MFDLSHHVYYENRGRKWSIRDKRKKESENIKEGEGVRRDGSLNESFKLICTSHGINKIKLENRIWGIIYIGICISCFSEL